MARSKLFLKTCQASEKGATIEGFADNGSPNMANKFEGVGIEAS
jgi:hypothetical protein